MNLKTWTILALSFSMILGCKFTQKITDGKMAFERKQYSVAVDMLNKEYKKADSRVEKGKIAFLLAESYKKINKNSSAIKGFFIKSEAPLLRQSLIISGSLLPERIMGTSLFGIFSI